MLLLFWGLLRRLRYQRLWETGNAAKNTNAQNVSILQDAVNRYNTIKGASSRQYLTDNLNTYEGPAKWRR